MQYVKPRVVYIRNLSSRTTLACRVNLGWLLDRRGSDSGTRSAYAYLASCSPENGPLRSDAIYFCYQACLSFS
jgi:hypothetical protein